jgi:hypothetical protein
MTHFMKKFFAIVVLVGALNLTSAVQAQNYSINWHTIGGGGGSSTGTSGTNTYTVSGTIGQPATASMSGGNYSLTGGFWSILAVVQTSGSPELNITRSGSQAILSWGAPATGFVLQQSSTLAPNSWTTSSAILTTNSTNVTVTVNVTNGYQFFRLKN